MKAYLVQSLSLCAMALVAEALLGYPDALFRRAGHPVTWMGALIGQLDLSLNRDASPARVRRAAGLAALLVLLAATGLSGVVTMALCEAILPPAAALVVLAILASSCLAQRSLDIHVRAVAEALERASLDAARQTVGRIVGRDTKTLDEAGIARAAIESLAENFADGIVAPAFWLALLGLPGGLLYKAVNTADSMIGHRTPRHAAFGYAAAKLDDAVNWLPARLAALWLVLASSLLSQTSMPAAWRVMRRDSGAHPSPNAGWPEAAMAGALGIMLGGPRAYAGAIVNDTPIGDGPRPADAAAIRLALRLYRIACTLQIAAISLDALLIARWP